MTSCRLHWLWFVLDLCREEDTPLLYTIISLRPERASMTHSSFLFSTKGGKIVATTRESLPTNQLSEPASHDANYYRQAFCSLGRQAHRTARVGGTNLGESILVSGGRFRGEVPGVRTEPVVGLTGTERKRGSSGWSSSSNRSQ